MKIFFDTEFLEDGKTIDLISIGLVREDGKELYLINKDMKVRQAIKDVWVRENVMKGIFSEMVLTRDRFLQDDERGFSERNFKNLLYYCGQSKSDIAESITYFVGRSPVFYAYCADYDWVALMQLYGKMIDKPKDWRFYCRDLRQTADETNFDTTIVLQGNQHNALGDARWNFMLFKEMSAIN